MNKIYDCAYAKKRLYEDKLKIGRKSPYAKKYAQVIEFYFKQYNEYPPLRKVFGGVSREEIKSRAKPKKNVVLTESQKWWDDYKKYIRSEKWLAFRRMILAKYECTCQKCWRKFKAGFLHVHHLHYKTFKNEKDEDVLLVCEKCHNEIHIEINRRKRAEKSVTKNKP